MTGHSVTSSSATAAGQSREPRLVLLSTSPRVAPGLLSAQAWSLLRRGHVRTRSAAHPQLPYLEAEGVDVTVDSAPTGESLAQRLVELAQGQTVVWLVAPDGDADLGHALPSALEKVESPPELELLPGSYDLPGAQLLDLVALMDRLRSPGGCPWDARQTHESLITYLVEETYETVEAVETGDRAHLREELGDLLLQVVFHARIAQEHPDAPWSIDDVAAGIVDKLVRRHPHVFLPAQQRHGHEGDAEDLETTWEKLKSVEKGRTSATDGIPPGLPALALGTKLLSRATRAGIEVPAPEEASIGGRLLALVTEAHAEGLDPETELRRTLRLYADAVRAAEEGAR